MEQPTVLIYNPDEETISAAAAILRFHGFAVTATSDPEEVLALATRQQPDILMVAAYGEQVDGLMVINQIRSQPSTSVIPVIITSTVSLPRIEQIARDLWCSYLEEPFDKVDLMDTIQDALTNPPSFIH